MKKVKATRRNKRHDANAKGNSRYARKKAYLAKYGGWGFEYPDPKPWK